MEDLDINGVIVTLDEILVRVRPAGGPGGQHANRNATAVDVVWTVSESLAGSPAWRARVESRAGSTIRASSTRHRSQWQNRRAALEVLAERIRDAARPERPRRPTRPTRASVERRVAEKARRSSTKATRRRPVAED
jgi:ribosome-associated protein